MEQYYLLVQKTSGFASRIDCNKPSRKETMENHWFSVCISHWSCKNDDQSNKDRIQVNCLPCQIDAWISFFFCFVWEHQDQNSNHHRKRFIDKPLMPSSMQRLVPIGLKFPVQDLIKVLNRKSWAFCGEFYWKWVWKFTKILWKCWVFFPESFKAKFSFG